MSQSDPLILNDKTRDALTAAQLYYLQDLTMDAIAAELHTSRSSVSRLLGFARESGLVEIQVRSPLDAPRQIERDIRQQFGVVAHVVPVPDQISDVDRLDRVALYAARILGGFFDSNMSMGIAWGATMSAVSRNLTMKPTHNSTIVQLNGAANPRTTGIAYASEILQRFGTAFGAAIQQFAVPAVFDNPVTRDALWQERSVSRVVERQRNVDISIFGIGSTFSEVPSHLYASNYLDDADMAQLRAEGVVGDVATVFYREDGTSEGITLNGRSSGPGMDVLRGIPRRVCVVSGSGKLHSLRGALAAGLITDLIIDLGTARQLAAGAETL